MAPGRSGLLSAVASGLFLQAALAQAQAVRRPPPRAADRAPVVASVFPPGVAAGGRETWTIRGRNLGQIQRLYVEGGGIEGTVRRATDAEAVVEVRAEAETAAGFREVRLGGPRGVSNLRLIRVDNRSQTPEREPNDTPVQATPLSGGAVGVGTLRPQDLDHCRVDARRGDRVVIDLEARRLGVSVAPVVTVMTPDGRALAQGRETPGVEGDCRFTFAFPADGAYVIQVRDNTYGGSEASVYRLRVTGDAFATGLFPLGGTRGMAVRVTATGGNLASPMSREVTLSDLAGAMVSAPPFSGPGGPVLVPGRLVAGEGPERSEAEADVSRDLEPGVTLNGRLDRPREVDRYRLKVARGDRVRVAVTAASLGSWLDSVVTVLDPSGKVLAENDDAEPRPRRSRAAATLLDPDSRLVLNADKDEEWSIKVADRYGRGGPEFAYRLEAGPSRPGFVVVLALEGPRGTRQGGPASGAFNLEPGGEVVVPFRVAFEGRPGPVLVSAIDLPEGVTAEPATVRPLPGGNRESDVTSASLVLRAGATAPPGLSWMRVVAVAGSGSSVRQTREVFAEVTLDAPDGPIPHRPVVRRLTRFPVQVVGEAGAGDLPIRSKPSGRSAEE
jgi:hypothetical protein